MPDADLLLPAGTRLLHIGPPKTATTAVQSGFHHNRDALAAQGVHYAGPNRHPMAAALAAARHHVTPGHRADSLDRWPGLLREIDEATAERVVVSSEFFADAPDDRVAAILDDLGRERTHVVVTLRSLAQILPSQWQQFTQVGEVRPYDVWLHDLFGTDRASGASDGGFWRRHRHGELVRRWAEAAGPERVTVVALDGREREGVLRVFEAMLGLENGTLRPDESDQNRSLTLEETVLVREANRQFVADGVAREHYTRLVRYGLATRLKVFPPRPDAAPVTTPAWAVERAVALGESAAEEIRALGVRVVGDLDALTVPPRAVGEVADPDAVHPDVAARGALGVVEAAVRHRERDARIAGREQRRAVVSAVRQARQRDGVPLRKATRRQIADELWSRLRRRLRRPPP